jgi:hypothetical protein
MVANAKQEPLRDSDNIAERRRSGNTTAELPSAAKKRYDGGKKLLRELQSNTSNGRD